MPEALTDDLGMNAGPQRQGRMGVPEVVQAALGQSRRFSAWVKARLTTRGCRSSPFSLVNT
jgi:hypothetical protein